MKPTNFAEFYILRNGSYVDALGSDSVLYLDGRWSLTNKKIAAADVCKARGFDGYRICCGTHTRPFYLTAAVQPVGEKQ